MSRERELLERLVSVDLSDIYDLLIEAQELLAQPEQEPIEDRIARWHKLGYEQGIKASKREPLGLEIMDVCGTEDYREGFKDGALYSEKCHGITGGE